MKCKNPKINANGKYEGVVYKYTNKITSLPYVGETENEEERQKQWRNQGNNSYGGKKINQARIDYGVCDDAWIYIVLEIIIADTQKELEAILKKRETYWIVHEDSVEHGYNSSYGTGNLGIRFDPERAKKCGNAMRGKHHTPETKAKISASGMGRIVSDETKAKISKSAKGKKRTPEQCKAMSDARKGIIPLAAKEGADRWREKNGGSYWKGKTMSDEAHANMKKVQQERGTSCVAIFPDGHEESYNTMLDAAKATGHNVGSVASAIKTGGITRKGFKFRKL